MCNVPSDCLNLNCVNGVCQSSLCLIDEVSWGGACYFFSGVGTDWHAAEVQCEARGMALVTIEELEENAFVAQGAISTSWIGLYVPGSTGTGGTSGTGGTAAIGGTTGSGGAAAIGGTTGSGGISATGGAGGGSDRSWIWYATSQEPLYTSWANGQPSLDNALTCAESSKSGLWSADLCSRLLPFVCERRASGQCCPNPQLCCDCC
jgi:hypothetical protein